MFEWFATSALQSFWAYITSWAALDIVVGCVAVAIAVLMPKQLDFVTDLRKWAICVAAVAFTLAGAIAHGYKLGLAEKERQWNAAIVREIDRGETARDDAVRDIGPVTTDRSVFRGDPDNRNRDGRKQACE